MSELAQHIVTSHKAAAKRAVAHLARTRKLKLSSSESLELVASVLGVANWQTLLAMANEGRGPRIDDTKPAVLPLPEPSIVDRLARYFARPNNVVLSAHPSHTRNDYWDFQCANLSTRLGYWEFVEFRIKERNEMLPWERDTWFAVKLARAAGMSVEFNETGDGWSLNDPWGIAFYADQDSEKHAWNEASEAVEIHLARTRGLSHRQMAAMSEQEWLGLAADVFKAPATPG